MLHNNDIELYIIGFRTYIYYIAQSVNVNVDNDHAPTCGNAYSFLQNSVLQPYTCRLYTPTSFRLPS